MKRFIFYFKTSSGTRSYMTKNYLISIIIKIGFRKFYKKNPIKYWALGICSSNHKFSPIKKFFIYQAPVPLNDDTHLRFVEAVFVSYAY